MHRNGKILIPVYHIYLMEDSTHIMDNHRMHVLMIKGREFSLAEVEVHVSYHRRNIKNFFNWDTVVYSILIWIASTLHLGDSQVLNRVPTSITASMKENGGNMLKASVKLVWNSI